MKPPWEDHVAARAEVLLGLADSLADRLADAARARTSVAAQRALLRAIGVSGLAPDGRSLALEVVHRFAAADRRLLRTGIVLPFALAAHEYDLDPQQLALEVIDGHVDLAAEADLLRRRERAKPARALLETWLAAADNRFEANRVARAELADLFGQPPLPAVAVEERAFDARDAATHAAMLVTSGADLVRVRVPRDGELRDDLGAVATEDEWPVGPEAPPPAGSQRGLAVVRAALDEAGAAAGRYPGLAIRRVGLAAPELALVAGFERVDAVFTDPMEAIAQVGVDPDRALADHALAQALLARSGARLVLPAGPVAEPTTWAAPAQVAAASGRALALQALSRAFALRNGFPADRLDLDACPPFAVTRDGALHPLVDVALRALLFPQHRLVVEDQVGEAAGVALPAMIATWAAEPARIGTVFVRADAPRLDRERDAVRGALLAAAVLVDARSVGEFRGAALDMARTTLNAAIETLEAIERGGLASVFGHSDRIGATGLEARGPRDAASAWAWGEERHLDEISVPSETPNG